MTESEGVSRWAIPKTWSWVSIGDVCEVVGGGTPSTAEAKNFDGGDIPWITPADLSGYTGKFIEAGARSITRSGLEGSGARLMPAGTVLFSSRAPIGYVAIAKGPVATNQGFKSFIPPTGLNSDYLYYYLKHAKGLAVELSSGTTFQEISGKKAAQIPLVVAPEPEQERIVEKLEELLSDLDAGVSALERARANLKRYRAAVLKAAVEGRLTEKWRAAHPDVEPAEKLLERILGERRRKWEEAQLKKFAEKKQAPPKGWKDKYQEPVKPDVSELPKLPEGWCWGTLDQLAEIGTGATPLRSEPRYWAGGTIPWVTSAVVNAPFVRETSELVTASALAETNLFLYPMNTLVLAMYGEGKTRGKVSELLLESTTNQALAALVFCGSSSACRPYVKTFLAKSYEDMRRVAAGGVQPNLNLGLIREMRVPLPPLNEQAEISVAIERLLSVQERLVQESETSVIRSSRLRQSILKRAFEGKLVPQDPKDEPASELLARIRAERIKEKGQTGGAIRRRK